MAGRVLVAEDNDDYRTVLRLLFSSVGCTVVEASNGLEAIESAESTHPDLIIMDWIMPRLGGLEATKRLKQNPTTRGIPVVICTALGMEALGNNKLLDCADEIIQKPVQLDKIRALVQQYVPAHETEQKQTASTVEKNKSIDVLQAWRLLQKIKQTMNEDSRQVGLPEAHNFNGREEDGPPMVAEKNL
jgi:CheY-like chemotaxis protein